MAYTLLASACPSPQFQTSGIDPSALSPTQSPELALGDTTLLLSKFNELSARVDAAGRALGAYAVVRGLAISAAAGLNLTIASGQAQFDSVTTITSNQNEVLPDNTARVYLWLSQSGSIVQEVTTAAPGVGYCFLGSAVTLAGAITSVDMSGVLKLVGSTLLRFCADTSAPTDTPPAMAFLTVGTSGLWLWDGSAYHCLQGGRAALTYAADSDHTLTSAEWENGCLVYGSGGTTLTGTRKAVLPILAGRSWIVTNGSPGAQSLQFIGASGTGVTVANGKTQLIYCDGTNFVAAAAATP